MTTIEKTVTREEVEEKTVTTCDCCGRPETEIESEMNRIRAEPSVTTKIGIRVLDSQSGELVEDAAFETEDGVRDYLDRQYDDVLITKKQTYNRDGLIAVPETYVRLDWEWDAIMCGHCIETMLSAFTTDKDDVDSGRDTSDVVMTTNGEEVFADGGGTVRVTGAMVKDTLTRDEPWKDR